MVLTGEYYGHLAVSAFSSMLGENYTIVEYDSEKLDLNYSSYKLIFEYVKIIQNHKHIASPKKGRAKQNG